MLAGRASLHLVNKRRLRLLMCWLLGSRPLLPCWGTSGRIRAWARLLAWWLISRIMVGWGLGIRGRCWKL